MYRANFGGHRQHGGGGGGGHQQAAASPLLQLMQFAPLLLLLLFSYLSRPSQPVYSLVQVGQKCWLACCSLRLGGRARATGGAVAAPSSAAVACATCSVSGVLWRACSSLLQICLLPYPHAHVSPAGAPAQPACPPSPLGPATHTQSREYAHHFTTATYEVPFYVRDAQEFHKSHPQGSRERCAGRGRAEMSAAPHYSMQLCASRGGSEYGTQPCCAPARYLQALVIHPPQLPFWLPSSCVVFQPTPPAAHSVRLEHSVEQEYREGLQHHCRNERLMQQRYAYYGYKQKAEVGCRG